MQRLMSAEEAALINKASVMSDVELTAATESAAREVSFHEAAEGDQWFKEAEKRAAARIRYFALRSVASARGLKIDTTGLLA